MNHRVRAPLCLLILLMCTTWQYARGQVQPDSNATAIVRQYLEAQSEALPEGYDAAELYDRFTEYAAKPLDINKAGSQQLKGLLILTDVEIAAILAHKQKFGRFANVYELQSIPELSLEKILLLSPFITTANTGLVLPAGSTGKFTLLARTARILETKAGYTTQSASAYTGSPQAAMVKLRGSIGNRLTMGLLVDKDAGEPLTAPQYYLPVDFLAGYLSYLGKRTLQNAIIGTYVLKFGQGLSLWNGWAAGKSYNTGTIIRGGEVLAPYLSANETSALQGGAATFSVAKNFTLTPFYSYKGIDATLGVDSSGYRGVKTVVTSGLHRSLGELAKYKNVAQQDYGIIADYTPFTKFNIGILAYRTAFDMPFIKQAALYKQFAFTGSNLTNFAIQYKANAGGLFLYGEAATNNFGQLAWQQGIIKVLSGATDVVLVARSYSPSYHSFYNRAVAQSSNGNNEQGLFLGLNTKLSPKTSFGSYIDVFRFPTARYRVNEPSKGIEVVEAVTFAPNKKHVSVLRARYQFNQQNAVATTRLIDKHQVNLRVQHTYSINKKLAVVGRAEGVYYADPKEITTGYLAFAETNYKPQKNLALSVRATYFNTPTFQSRLYALEQGVMYASNFAQFYGNGLRGYANVRGNLSKRLSLQGHIGCTKYFDREVISSGMEKIDANHRTDLQVQAIYNF